MSYYTIGVVLKDKNDIERSVEKQIEKYDFRYNPCSFSYNVNGKYDDYEIGCFKDCIPKKDNTYSNFCKIKDIDIDKKINIESIVVNEIWHENKTQQEIKEILENVDKNYYLIILRCHV